MNTLLSSSPPGAAVQEVARTLVAARRSGQLASTSPLRGAVTTDDDAYAVQDAVAQALGWFADGVPQCWKSGGASRDSVLSHARLPAAGVRTEGATLPDLPLHTPALEAEIALRLAEDVTPERAQRLASADAPALVDALAVAIEIADSRWEEGFQAPAALRLADQGSHGALILGKWMPVQAHDWTGQRCEVRFSGSPVITNTEGYSLGNPLWLLPIWLGHATRGGRTVAAGTVVTTGSWVGAIPMARDADVVVRFPGLGEVGLRKSTVHAALESPSSGETCSSS